MLYRTNPKNRQQLSILGYGCLRFSKKGMSTDQEKAERELLLALENGVNYFDTAYTYSGSEECLGKFLAKGHRDKVNIATKLPHYYLKQPGDMERYFKEQLERLRTDHVEYYLMHMLNDVAAWERIKKLGIVEWIEEKKAKGQIQNIGFSFHGNTDNFLKILEAYDWDFCQIQYNYMDEHSQAGKRGLKCAHEKGIPVIIMEPLRGGKLAALPKDQEEAFVSLHDQLARQSADQACSSFRTLQDQIADMLTVYAQCLEQARLQDNAVSTVKSYIRNHLYEELNRDSLAAMVYLNPDYLSHLFKRETGFSLTNYIIETRILESKRLLSKRDMSIQDIAIACGFQNISYFSRQFKRTTGMTPREFRKLGAPR